MKKLDLVDGKLGRIGSPKFANYITITKVEDGHIILDSGHKIHMPNAAVGDVLKVTFTEGNRGRFVSYLLLPPEE